MLVLCNALEITVEETLPGFEMCLHSKDDRLKTGRKNGSFLPQNGPPCGTTAWSMPC